MANSTINGTGNAWQLPSRGISIIGTLQEYTTYEEFLFDTSKSKLAWVIDATGDPTVKSGGALYRIEGKTITKIFEEESVDLEENIVITWDRVQNRPLSTVNAIDEAVSRAHVHANADVIDKFTFVDNVLMFDGAPIATDSTELDALRTELTSYINTKLSSVWVWKGSKSSFEEVQAVANPEVGWVYQVGSIEYAYNGLNWEELGYTMDLSNYFTKDEVTQAIATAKSEAINAAALDASTKADNAQASAIAAAAADATSKDNALHETITGEIATAKSEAISAAAEDAKSKADAAQAAAITTASEDALNKANAAQAAGEAAAATAKEEAIAAAASDATTKADAAQAAAIEAAAADAATKANTAKTEAIAAASDDATAKANAAKDLAIQTASENTASQISDATSGILASAKEEATSLANTAKTEAIATAAEDATAKANAAKDAAIAAAAEDATTKANAANAGAIEAANQYAGEQDTALHETITGEIATAKSEAISAAATDAADKDTALHTTISGEITSAKGAAISASNEYATGKFNEVSGNLTLHTENADIHVTVENKAQWNEAYEKAHVHNLTTNYSFVDEIFGCTEKVEVYKNHAEIIIPDESFTEFDFLVAVEPGYILIGDGKYYWIEATSAKFNGQIIDFSEGLTNPQAGASSNFVRAAIADGKLYVRAISKQTSIPTSGNLLGSVTSLGTDAWVSVDDNNWKKIDSMIDAWLAIDASGIMYSAGSYQFGRQGVATYTGVLNTLTPVEVDGAVANDWIDTGVGRYYYLGMRGTVDAEGNKVGTIYAWGNNATGCLGNGVSYRQDMKTAYAWVNGDVVIYTFATKPAKDDKAYTYNGVQVIIGAAAADSDGATLVIGETTYTRDSSKDIDPNTLGELKPVALAVPTFNTDGTVASTTVYDDWFAMSAGWYHAGALRKNANGETEIYLWGENEYGQLGNGKYVDSTLTSSSLSEEESNEVEIISWPTKLTTAQFPYTDAVAINCTHYGTFITRANGKMYFAGCNKRNYLGTGTFSDNTAFIPHFTELSTRFTNNTLLVSSYGSLVIRKSPRLSGEVDPVVAATLSGALTPENIDNAITSAHDHSISVNVIDAAAILVSQFAADIPNAVVNAHSHGNLTDLNAISVRNGNLYLNGIIFAGGASDTGTAVVVDPSNVQLDQLTDVTGLCNLAGGFGLEIMSYRKVSDTEAYIRVAPIGDVHNPYGRYVDLFNSSKTSLVPASEQAKGLYGIPSNSTSTAKYINNTKDIVDLMTTVRKKSGATLKLYYIDSDHSASPTSGTLYKTITYATIGDATKLLWKMVTGAHVQAYGEYLPIDLYTCGGVGAFQSEEKAFYDIYDNSGNLLLTEADSEYILTTDATFVDGTTYYTKSGTYYTKATVTAGAAVTADTYYVKRSLYFADGSVVTSSGAMVNPIGTDEEGKLIYQSIYGDEALTNLIIDAEVIKTGLFIKDGTMLVKLRQYMIPEKFNEDLFANGTLYIHPGDSNFSGMANQAYTFDTGSSVFLNATTADTDGTYPLESVILKLNQAVTNGDTTTTTEFVPEPGSIHNPMIASIYSPNRYSTTHVSGEYSSSFGLNSSASGNQATVAGDFATARGLCVINTGDFSHAEGVHLIVTGSYCNAVANNSVVSGVGNYVVGDAIITHSYYGYAFGSNHQLFGINPVAIGRRIAILTKTEGAISVGYNNTVKENGKSSLSVGNNLIVDAEDAIVIGNIGEIAPYVGNFPESINSSDLYNMTADAYATAGYDTKGVSHKGGLFFVAGDKDSREIVPSVPMKFTKYIMKANDAFFGASTGSTNRSQLEAYIYEPYLQWEVVGVMNLKFTSAVATDTNGTQFDIVERDGGRVKTFDPGIVKDNTEVNPVFDFNYGTRWKLATGGSYIPIPKNFVDGAEAYVIIYAGSTVAWTNFELDGNTDESDGSNHFDGIVWVGGEAPRAVDTMTSGFQMVKLMVVDNTVIAQLLADTCA